MSETTETVILNGIEFKLIGTAHISRESIEEVKKIIYEEKPDIVCVELDQGRYNSIVQNDTWEKLNLSKVFKEGKGFLLIANLILGSFQRRIGSELGVKPGEEMKTAVEVAKEMNIPYSLCDREVQTTLRRAWVRCGFWSKSKLLASLLASAFTTEKLNEQEIENLKKRNELDGMMNELANYLPGVKAVLIDERDRYLAAKIWKSAQDTDPAAKKIVAVIGAGHMQGIKSYLEKLNKGEETSDVSELDLIPPPGLLSKSVRFIIPAAIIALITTGFIRAGTDIGLSMILQWVLWNGSLAAIGAIIALAHPLAIVVSFLGAPITTLSPFIGVGILSGLVQLTLRKPRVSDVQDISADTVNIKGWYRNRITRTLLVFFFSSLGSSIGTFVSVPVIARLLGGH
jgi:pheromone shutdown-related protein TraB